MLADTILLEKNESVPRILVVSVRGFRFQVANCTLYEFEDLICDLEGAKLYGPNQEFPLARKAYRLAKYTTGSDKIASAIAPFPSEVVLEHDYDLLFAVFDNPWQLHLLELVKNWRDKCRHKSCYIMDTWKPFFENWRLVQEPFRSFDHIFSGMAHSVETITEITGVPCDYLAPGVNALEFCPYPNPPLREIDVCWVGRRMVKAHEKLFQYSQQNDGFFYYYDTINNQILEVSNPQEHRAKLINLLQRSRYTMVTHARIDALNETGGVQEMGYRYFEGVASGSVLIGMPPLGDQFPGYFGWEDAIVEVDLYEHDALEVIQDLNANPDRVEDIRCRNVANALLKHDWVYRWREVLATFSLVPSPAVIAREKQLRQLANRVSTGELSLVR